MVREVRSSKRLQVLQDQKEKARKSRPLLQKKTSTSDNFLTKQIQIIQNEGRKAGKSVAEAGMGMRDEARSRMGGSREGSGRGVVRGGGRGQGSSEVSQRRQKSGKDPLPSSSLPSANGRKNRTVVLRRNGKFIPQKAPVKIGKSTEIQRKQMETTTKAKPKTKNEKNKKPSTTRSLRPRLTKKVLSSFEEETLGIRPIDRGSSWDGNSDSLGSVNSGVLDENICFQCGVETSENESGDMILCDGCDGEYHLACVGLASLPRITWTCGRCREERAWFANLKYEVPNFKIPRRRAQKIEICYSPSRPLSVAWEECQEKGFMVVKDVFTPEVMRKLTHGTIHKITSSGRVADTWFGASATITKKLKESGHNLINRDGRFDLKLPLFVVSELGLPEILEPILNHLRRIMKTSSKPILRTHNVVFAPVGSKSQSWHVDDSLRSRKGIHSYFTILIHLNPIDDKCGGTEIWSNALKRGDMIRPRPGDAFVFNGSLLHRGQENAGFSHRFFYYASFSCGADTNDAN